MAVRLAVLQLMLTSLLTNGFQEERVVVEVILQEQNLPLTSIP